MTTLKSYFVSIKKLYKFLIGPKCLQMREKCTIEVTIVKLIFRLYDANSSSVIARYEIHRILFYARGAVDSPEASCFAFTWSHGDTQESAIFQCHVFRCDIAEAVTRVSGNVFTNYH